MSEDSVQRDLGSLIKAVEMLAEQLRRSDVKSDESRAAMHRRMDDLVANSHDLAARIDVLAPQVASSKAVTDEVTRWKHMGLGALGVIGIGGTAIGVTFGEAIRRIIGLKGG